MRTRGKLLLLLIVTITSLIMLTGCVPYNATIYSHAHTIRSWIDEDFYESHLTSGAYSELKKDYVEGEEYPEKRILKLTDRTQFDEIFKEFPEEVDFDKSMILMYGRTTPGNSDYKIKNISVKDGVLTVELKAKWKSPFIADASIPLTKWIIVIMDKVEANEVNFVFL